MSRATRATKALERAGMGSPQVVGGAPGIGRGAQGLEAAADGFHVAPGPAVIGVAVEPGLPEGAIVVGGLAGTQQGIPLGRLFHRAA